MGDTITIQVPLTFRKHPYERIRLVGYSCGATLARKVFLAAWGEAEDVPGGDRTPVWAPAIERVMSVAGINSGWTVTCALSWASTTLWTLLQGVGELIPFATRRSLTTGLAPASWSRPPAVAGADAHGGAESSFAAWVKARTTEEMNSVTFPRD